MMNRSFMMRITFRMSVDVRQDLSGHAPSPQLHRTKVPGDTKVWFTRTLE